MRMTSLDVETVCFMVHGSRFEAEKRYTVLEPVGQGAYGVVCSAQDDERNETVAIKKIEHAFEDLTFAKRTLRELRILRHLRHENLIAMRHAFVPGSRETFEDIYVVSELMEADLASILKSPQPLSDDHCQFFLYQILRGLKYVHSAEVIHRDLKPRNLLVNSNCDLKICDYGLARVHHPEAEFMACPMTEYVCTRWYRAPEVLCSWTDYGKPMDVWSVGCIFAEMLNRKPIFPGKNTQHQLQLIISCLGTPDKDTMRRITNDKCRRFIEAMPSTGGRPLGEAVASASTKALDVVEKILLFDPGRRVTVEQVLQHPYLKQLHCPEDEPVREPLDLSDFEFERRKIDLEVLREEIFLEVLRYHPRRSQKCAEERLRNGVPCQISACRLLNPGESQYTCED